MGQRLAACCVLRRNITLIRGTTRSAGSPLPDTHTHTFIYAHNTLFLPVCTTCAAGLILATRLTRASLSTACSNVPYYCHMYFLELKAAVTELSKQCCRMLLL